MCLYVFFFSSRRRHTRCALVTGVQTCALPIYCSKTNLVWDSRRQNTLDRKWVDRHKKLTTAQAAEIKRRLSEGEYGRALAREFNVSKTSIYFIKIGKHHADVMLNGARAWK